MDYQLIRSDRRTISMEIKSGQVLVRAPKQLDSRAIDRFVAAHRDWAERHLAGQTRRRENHPEPDDALRAEYIRRAKAVLPGRLTYYGGLMGLHPAGLTITGARTRFGSCSSAGRISFSWRLMQYPDAAVDYVVVHELAHLRYLNHGRDFYALIEKTLPDYKAARKLLKE